MIQDVQFLVAGDFGGCLIGMRDFALVIGDRRLQIFITSWVFDTQSDFSLKPGDLVTVRHHLKSLATRNHSF